MSFLLKDKIHSSVADSIFDEIISRRANYYFYIGRVINWTDESSPPTPSVSKEYEKDTRRRIINLKKINSSDVSLVIPRKNWSTGRAYDQFQDYDSSNTSATGATTLKTSDFYVLTSNFQVYKCISNNGGVNSTEEPTSTDLNVFSTSDGYKWKFMYGIPLATRNRFLSSTHMPVTKSVLNPFYNNGEIERVTIVDRGSGYLGNAGVSLAVLAPTHTGANAVANIFPILNQSGSFEKVLVRDGGNNYANAVIQIVDPTNSGSNLFPNVTLGNVNSTIQPLFKGSTANLQPLIANGIIQSVVVVDPGQGYTSNIQTTITVTGDGANAGLVPFVNTAGEVEDVVIVNRGEGYTSATLTVTGTQGSGANLTVDLSTGDLDTSQSTVELAAKDGAIENFIIVRSGDSYTPNDVTVTVRGDGQGFEGTVGVSNNSISNITITNPGLGFTFANVTISGNVGANAQVIPIFSPPGGHGFDAPSELFADTLAFFSTINEEKIHSVTVNNDFRQFGIIKDIKRYQNTLTYQNTLATPTFLANFTSSVSTYQNDQVLTLKDGANLDSNVQYVIVEAVGGSANQLLLTGLNNHRLTTGNILQVGDTGSNTITVSAQVLPDINKFSGDLLFIDNRTKVSQSADQVVTIKTTLQL